MFIPFELSGLFPLGEGEIDAKTTLDSRSLGHGVATPLAPGVPPIADVLPGYESTTWFGLFGPRGLQPGVVSRLNTAANQVLQDPEVIDKLQSLGIEPVGSTPVQFTTMLAKESAKWKKIISERKIMLE
eukprot:gene22182-27141_t